MYNISVNLIILCKLIRTTRESDAENQTKEGAENRLARESRENGN